MHINEECAGGTGILWSSCKIRVMCSGYCRSLVTCETIILPPLHLRLFIDIMSLVIRK
jgi:hypothetical protein